MRVSSEFYFKKKLNIIWFKTPNQHPPFRHDFKCRFDQMSPVVFFDQMLSVGVFDQMLSVVFSDQMLLVVFFRSIIFGMFFRSIDVGRCFSNKCFGSFFDQMLLVGVVSRPQLSLCTYGANGGGWKSLCAQAANICRMLLQIGSIKFASLVTCKKPNCHGFKQRHPKLTIIVISKLFT